MLLQDRVSLEWFGPIEQVAIRDQNPAAVGSKAFCDRDHLRIEISDPLHLEVFIEFLALDHTRSFHDHEGVDTFTLVFRYDPEYEADEFIDEYGNIDLKKCRKVSLSVLQELNNRYQLRDGDIIFGKIGTIGEPKRLKAWREVTISANVILIQPHNTPGFIFWVLNSDFIKTQVKNTIHSTTQPAFGMEKIRTLIIPFPPKPEREQLEKILNKSEDNLISTRIRLYKLQSLKMGLMQDLLAGKVRVKIKEELA